MPPPRPASRIPSCPTPSATATKSSRAAPATARIRWASRRSASRRTRPCAAATSSPAPTASWWPARASGAARRWNSRRRRRRSSSASGIRRWWRRNKTKNARCEPGILTKANGEKLRRADLGEELRDLAAERLALRLQRLGGALDVVGRGSGCVRIGLHAVDVLGDVAGALRGELRAAGDLLGRRTLLLHGGGNGGCDLVDLADDAADGLDGVDRIARDLLDVGDLLGDFLRRLRGLARQRLHFGGDHREAAAGLAGARRLDGGVKRKQIGL